jgi:hypothetical protein
VRTWVTWCLLVGLHALSAAVQAQDPETCDPLTQSCALANQDARTKLLEHHMKGSTVPKVAEAVVTTSADAQLPASTPTTAQGLRIYFHYKLDASREPQDKEFIEKRVMPAVASTLSRSIRVPFPVHHTVHECPAWCAYL